MNISKKTVLCLAPLLANEMEKLEQSCNVIRLYRESDPEGVLQAHKNDIGAILSTHSTPVRRSLIDALPQLGLIAQNAVGTDNVDLAAAHARGIAVTNTPDVLTDDTADIALALLLACSRRIVEADMYVRVGRWSAGPMPLGTTPKGKTVGIVGLGRIGQAIAKRLAAFDMRIVYHGRRQKTDAPYAYYKDLNEMAKACDYLILACSGGPDTHHIVNKSVLADLGPRGYLINVSRGSVVDTEALINALVGKVIAGAGLDVYETEPNVPEPLKSMDNVVLLPHIGSATFETRTIMGEIVLANIMAYFAGKPLITPVT